MLHARQCACGRVQHYANSHNDFSHCSRFDFCEFALPAFANFLGKTVGVRRVFVAPAIAGIAIDRQRARLDPDFGGPLAAHDTFTENAD